MFSSWLDWGYEFCSSNSKESACNAGDLGLIPGSGKSPGEENGNPPQYSCLENPHGQKSLAGYSPWGCKKSDMSEWLAHACACVRTHTHTHTHTHRFWGRRFKKVKCHSHHIPSQHMSKWLTSVDVDLDHLAKVVYIRFPHWNYFFPPFYTVLFCRKSWVQGTLKNEELYFTSWGWLHWFWISYAPEIFSLLSHLFGASQGHCFSVTKA